MLITAREMDCQHIWNAHAGSGREAGVSDIAVDKLRDEEDLSDLPHDEQIVVNYGQELFRRHQASRGAFQSILEQFGKQGAVELTLIFGNYAMLALSINAFDSDLPPNRTELLFPI